MVIIYPHIVKMRFYMVGIVVVLKCIKSPPNQRSSRGSKDEIKMYILISYSIML